MSMKRPKQSTKVLEVYGRGSINDQANLSRRDLNIKGVGALDLRTCKPDGTPWDFSKRVDRQQARDLVAAEDPDWIVGSPPCTAFSIWNFAMNFPKMPKERVDQALAEGRVHLKFMASLYRRQIRRGKYFLHEHPSTALSWKEPEISDLMRLPYVHSVVAHQCMFGLVTPSSDGGEPMPAMKRTRFMTNSFPMTLRLNRVCDESHAHQQLVGGRCAQAAFYPLPLVKAILLGIYKRHARCSPGSIPERVRSPTTSQFHFPIFWRHPFRG